MRGRQLTILSIAIAGLCGLSIAALPAWAQQAPVRSSSAKSPTTGKAKAVSKAKLKAGAKAAAAAAAAQGPDGGTPAVDAEASLDKAREALKDGKADVALSLAGAVLNASGKDARNTARALAVRGEAHLRQGRPADALADLDSALWVKGGLMGAERDVASKARSQALALAGAPPENAPIRRAETTPVPAIAVAAPPVAAPLAPAQALRSEPPRTAARAPATEPSPATRSSTWQVTAIPHEAASPLRDTPAAAGNPQPSTGIGGFFANLFGAASSPTPETTSSLPAPPAAALSSSPPQRAPSQGASDSQRQPARASVAAVQASPRAALPAAPATRAALTEPRSSATTARPQSLVEDGGYRLQLGAVRSKGEAQSMAERVRAEHGSAVANRPVEIDEAVYGNMGRFYRVRIGGFATPNESQALCAALRNSGVDCMVVGP